MNTNLKTLFMIAIVLAGLADQSLSQCTTLSNSLSGSDFVGSSNPADVVFKSQNIERMRIKVNGAVNIGTTSSGIEVVEQGKVPSRRGISTDTDPNGHFDFFINSWQSANGIPSFRFKNGITAANAPATTANNAPDLMTLDVTGSLGIGATNGSGIEILTRGRAPVRRGISTDTDPNGHFDFFINGWQSANSMPAFRFKNGITAAGTPATNAANAPDLMTLDARGTLRIGKQTVPSANPHSNSLLQVSGKIACKELIVLDPSKWADDVFAADYELMSLANLERYYLRHKHLPGVPTETEVKQNGINTAQMEVTLLRKVEELTLYVVAQNKRIDQLEAENDALTQSHRSPRFKQTKSRKEQ